MKPSGQVRSGSVISLFVLLALSVPCTGWSSGSPRSDEGPFIGGVFSRVAGRQPTNAVSTPDLRLPAAQYDKDGNSSELIVAFRYDNPGLIVSAEAAGKVLADLRGSDVALANARYHADVEQAIVDGVETNDTKIRSKLSGALHARPLMDGVRLPAEMRALLTDNHPRERLEQYLVLSYPDVEAALQAMDTLSRDPVVAYVGNNIKFDFAWAPNDLYFAYQASASTSGRYQWGLYAMNFPAAWDVTTGFGYVGDADAGLLNNTAPADLVGNYRPQFSFTTPGWDALSSSNKSFYAFHGTHVIGIIAASANNQIGVAGVCPTCSVAVGAHFNGTADIATSFTRLSEQGFQVINASFENQNDCQSDLSLQPICDAIAFADSRDVLIVASAGNYTQSRPAFPARQASVQAVAGAQNNSPTLPTSWSVWATSGQIGSDGSSYAGASGVIAPAKSIVSTAPIGAAYYVTSSYDCSDQTPGDNSGVSGDGYATCTGTSMAAPHVSGLAGLLRSIQPVLTKDTIKTQIRLSANNALAPNAQIGYGMPNALVAVNKVLNLSQPNITTPTRLTPMFAFYSPTRYDYFYTSVPQMGSAALWGTLAPHGVNGAKVVNHSALSARYNPAGRATVYSGQYQSLPGQPPGVGAPTADFWLFTTPRNPKSTSPLVPLYRMSWACGDYTPYPPTICANVPEHIDTVYTADPVGVTTFQSWGYKLDGIEGYIYPKSLSQPAGTQRLMRKYNPNRDDHAIFPESMLANMTAQGYTQDSGSDWLGYVYLNNGSVPTIQ